MSINQNIAIIKLSAIGDIALSVFVCEFIKQKYPTSKISWFVQKGFGEIIKHNPYCDNINEIDLKAIKTNKKAIFDILKDIKQYKQNNYDIIIDMQGLIKSAILAKLLSSKNSQIVGFCKNSIKEGIASWFYDKCVEIPYAQNIIKRNYTIINKALKLNIKDLDIKNKNKSLFFKSSSRKYPIKKNKKNILLINGASLKNKIYPKEQFAQVINDIKNKDYNFILVWANKNEKVTAIYLNNIAKHNNTSLIKKPFSLNELKVCASKCDMLLGGDTGPTHFSFGLNIGSITLFGNTPAFRNTYKTPTNKVLCDSNNKNINPLKLNKQDFSIGDIKPQTITKTIKNVLFAKYATN